MASAEDAVFGDRSRLAQKLEDIKAERDQLLYQNQLLAADLKVFADSARGYCEERDELEGRVEGLEGELSDMADHIVELETALNTARSERDTAAARAAFQRTRQ